MQNEDHENPQIIPKCKEKTGDVVPLNMDFAAEHFLLDARLTGLTRSSVEPLYAPRTRPQPQVQKQPPQTSSAAIFTHDIAIYSTSPPACTTLNLPTSSILS